MNPIVRRYAASLAMCLRARAALDLDAERQALDQLDAAWDAMGEHELEIARSLNAGVGQGIYSIDELETIPTTATREEKDILAFTGASGQGGTFNSWVLGFSLGSVHSQIRHLAA